MLMPLPRVHQSLQTGSQADIDSSGTSAGYRPYHPWLRFDLSITA
jgi:hypothetical protein